jgi:class 3 adenylate cyclase
MTRQHGVSGPGGEPSIHVNADTISGGQFSLGGHGNVFNQGPAPAEGSPGDQRQHVGDPPVNALYAFGDIVGYSGFNARLQEESQDRLRRCLDRSLAEAGVEPDLVVMQDQGDARLLCFPAAVDVARVLALMPHYLNGDLQARNEDLAPHARLRVRLSLAMGPAVTGATGLVGEAPITVVRLGNSARFRSAMKSALQVHCGVIADDQLYRAYIRQDFRPDMHAAEYVPVQVLEPAKGFKAQAWIRLFGCSPQQTATLVG